jgi:hypothetical protein
MVFQTIDSIHIDKGAMVFERACEISIGVNFDVLEKYIKMDTEVDTFSIAALVVDYGLDYPNDPCQTFITDLGPFEVGHSVETKPNDSEIFVFFDQTDIGIMDSTFE